MSITKCPECGTVVALRFPIHVCKSVKVFDGDNQKLIDKITIEEREERLKSLQQIYFEANVDSDGDIVFYRES